MQGADQDSGKPSMVTWPRHRNRSDLSALKGDGPGPDLVRVWVTLGTRSPAVQWPKRHLDLAASWV